MYSFDENELIVKTKENVCFDLKMRGSICIINGGSGSGKTFLCEYIQNAKNSLNMDFGERFSNVFILNVQNKNQIIELKNNLIIIDRADLVMTKDLADFINRDKKNKYLVMARGVTGIDVSPNYYATLQKERNCFKLNYAFSEKEWF